MAEAPNVAFHAYADSGVLITGGTSGVGLASAIQFAQAGVRRIGLVGRNAERGENARQAVLAACPEANVFFFQGDANVLEQTQRVVAEAAEKLGSIDVLLNSTIDMSRYTPGPLINLSAADIGPTMMSVVLVPMHMSCLALPYMKQRRGGVILNGASDAAKVPTPGETILGAAMAAITVFSRTLSMEAKRFGVRVNCLTPSLKQLLAQRRRGAERKERTRNRFLLKSCSASSSSSFPPRLCAETALLFSRLSK